MARKYEGEHRGDCYSEKLSKVSRDSILNTTDQSRLVDDIALLIGRYRDKAQARETTATKAHVLEHNSRTQALINDLMQHLGQTPAAVEAHIDLALYEAKQPGDDLYHYDNLHSDLAAQLIRYSALTKCSTSEANRWPDTTGMRNKHLEHELLSDIAELYESLGFGVTQAAREAAKIAINEIEYFESQEALENDARRIIHRYRIGAETGHKSGQS